MVDGLDPATLRLAHISLALLSVGGFCFRAGLMTLNSDWLNSRLSRRLPHMIDVLLLTSGITLAWVFSFNPTEQPWLAVKLFLLLAYIIFGAFGLRYASTLTRRLLCCAMALVCVCGIMYLAHYKPLLFAA